MAKKVRTLADALDLVERVLTEDLAKLLARARAKAKARKPRGANA